MNLESNDKLVSYYAKTVRDKCRDAFSNSQEGTIECVMKHLITALDLLDLCEKGDYGIAQHHAELALMKLYGIYLVREM